MVHDSKKEERKTGGWRGELHQREGCKAKTTADQKHSQAHLTFLQNILMITKTIMRHGEVKANYVDLFLEGEHLITSGLTLPNMVVAIMNSVF